MKKSIKKYVAIALQLLASACSLSRNAAERLHHTADAVQYGALFAIGVGFILMVYLYLRKRLRNRRDGEAS